MESFCASSGHLLHFKFLALYITFSNSIQIFLFKKQRGKNEQICFNIPDGVIHTLPIKYQDQSFDLPLFFPGISKAS